MDDERDIGVIGKGKRCNWFPCTLIIVLAVNIPLRNRTEADTIRMQNTNPMNNLFDQDNDNTDTMSDEFDSDSKENESVSLAKIY